MNPNYMNPSAQGPAAAYGGGPPFGNAPPPPQGGMMNGGQPGGQQPPAMKAPYNPMQNGPGNFAGPQGDQFQPRNGPPSFRGPSPTNQLSNQMGGMTLGGLPRQAGPPSAPSGPPMMRAPMNGQPPPQPPPPTHGFGGAPPATGPPPNTATIGPPPVSSASGFPPPPMSSASGFPPPPMSSASGFPPPLMSSASGFPPPPMSSASGLPPPPASSTAGFPPPPPSSSSTSGYAARPPAAPPTSNYGGPPLPPPPSGQPPPPSAAGYGGPPTSQGYGGPPTSQGYGGPPTSQGYGAQPTSQGYGAQPTSQGYGAPPTSQGYGAPPTSQGYAGPPPPPPSNSMYSGNATHPGSTMAPPPAAAGFPAPPPSPGSRGAMPAAAAAAGAGGYNQFPPTAAAPAAQPRRLDPDQMPSPIQVMLDDQRTRGGVFETGQRGSVPPLVTTEFVVTDQGHASPRLLRSSMYSVPATNEMLKQSHLPFVVNIAPFAKPHPKETAPPVVDLGQLGPVRCNRCKAYMCPYMLFIDGGRRFQCAFCSCATEVPPEYFAHLDHTGRRTDCYERPELCLGTYEFVATTDYCKDNVLPKPPAFIFMLDVSYNSIKSGLVHLMCERLKEDVLQNLPKEAGMDESEIRVGFVTYHKELHFYNVKGSLAQPQMLVVSDVQDVFVPLLDGFLVKLSESEAVIDSLMEQIPQMFAENRETEIVLGPVIQAGLDALKAANCSGKLFIFHSSLPIGEAPGKLKNRDDRKLLGTDKEKTVLSPQIPFYSKLGEECVAAGCGVDIYLFPNAYTDIATIAEVPRLTGGSLYKYQYFQADLDGERLMKNLANNVSRPIAFDAIMRVRTSTGIRPVDFLGNFYMSNTTDVELACIDCDKAISVEIKHDDKLSEADGAYMQAAILYTSASGQRRLRCVNMAFNVCAQLADMFRNCELDVLTNYMAKQAIRGSLNGTPKAVREVLMTQCAQILACYRKNCASPSSAGQLILPECMKLLPVYTNCIIKNGILCGSSDISTDERSFQMMRCNAMSVQESVPFLYPRLLPLHDVDVDATDLPHPIRCSYERLKDTGVYLLDNSFMMFLWIGVNVASKWVQDVFGVQSAAQIDIDMTGLHDLDTAMSRRVRAIVKKVRQDRSAFLKLSIIRQRDKLEPVFQQYLVEDRSASGSASYVDFLCHIHKEIRGLLS